MEPTQSGQLGTMINTQPSPQQLPDPNVASLVPQQGGQLMDVNVAKAALGTATHLQSFLLPQKKGDAKPAEEGSIDPQNAPGDVSAPKDEEKADKGMEERLMKQIDQLKEQITNNHQSDEISRIRQELTDLLKDDGEQK